MVVVRELKKAPQVYISLFRKEHGNKAEKAAFYHTII